MLKITCAHTVSKRILVSVISSKRCIHRPLDMSTGEYSHAEVDYQINVTNAVISDLLFS